MKQNRNGFTLMEMLIVIAMIAVLIIIAIPVFASQLEKAREAADLANVRSAYAQVSEEVMLGNPGTIVSVNLTQKEADWQSMEPVNIGGITHSKNQEDTDKLERHCRTKRDLCRVVWGRPWNHSYLERTCTEIPI